MAPVEERFVVVVVVAGEAVVVVVESSHHHHHPQSLAKRTAAPGPNCLDAVLAGKRKKTVSE